MRSRLPSLLLWLILALAAALRLFRLNVGEYQWDDDGIWSLAVNAVARHVLPAAGINSTVGASNGPAMVWLLMPFAAVARTPMAGIVGLALLNVAAVYFVYRFVREFFGERPALLAALLFAVNSWALVFSRHIVVQALLIPIQVLFFWSAARWLARGRTADLVLAFLWLAIVSQSYIEGLLHLGSMAIILAIGWRKLRVWPLLAGGSLFLALCAPYLIHLVVNDSRWLQLAASGGGQPVVDGSSVWYAAVQAMHTGFERDAPQMDSVIAPVSGLETAFAALEVALYAGGIGYMLLRLIRLGREGRDDRARVVGMLFAWLLFPIAIYVRHQDILSWRHLVLTLPLPAIFSGLLLDRL
ncbi:MAG: glycosyltransferase family 39 protein, partial [Chloroflexota bacterium]